MTYKVRWADIDLNRHVNYAAYIEAATELRYMFFLEHNLLPDTFEKVGDQSNIYHYVHQLLQGSALGRDDHHHVPACWDVGTWHPLADQAQFSQRPMAKRRFLLALEGTFLDLKTAPTHKTYA